MAYQAFVASTKQDLERERTYVIEGLEKSGMKVVHMKSFAAAPEAPSDLSAGNVTDCDFCVAIVAFQRGSIAPNDPAGRSITQIEIDTAVEKGVDVLLYMLKDTAENREKWPERFTQFDDHRLVAWRETLALRHTVEFFDAGQMPEVLPAITRRIIKREKQSRKRLKRAFQIVAAAFIFLTLVPPILLWTSQGVREWTLSKYLNWNDPTLFQGASSGRYRIVRVFGSYAAVKEEAPFGFDISPTRTEFRMFANTFGFYRDHSAGFEDLTKRGVRLKFLVTAFRDEDRVHWESFAKLQGEKNIEETVAQAENIRSKILELRRKYPDLVELRLNRKPLLYTMWIRDPEEASGVAHLGVHYYGDKSVQPSFRISKTTAQEMFPIMVKQFDQLWNDAERVH